MLNIYIARHGQDEDNQNGILNGHRDSPLTNTGIAQAFELANEIKNVKLHFDKIYSSPLQRASRLAEIVADTIKAKPPIILQELIERDFGIMTGQLTSRVLDLCSPDVLHTATINYFLSPEGAETFPQLIDRANKILGLVNRRHRNGNVLLVTHGDIGKMIYCAYYKLDWKDVLKMFHFGNSELLFMSPNSSPDKTHVFHVRQYNS